MSKTSYTGLKVKIVFKVLLFSVMVPVLFMLGAKVWGQAVYKPEKNDEASLVKRCDRYYFEGDYAGLYDIMCLYKMDSDTFDLYWEVVDTAMAYENLKQWYRAKERGLDDCDEKIELYYNEVMSYAKNCRFEENKDTLEDYARRAKEFY